MSKSSQTDRYERWKNWTKDDTHPDWNRTGTIIAKSIMYGIRNGEGEPAWGSKENRDAFMAWCVKWKVLEGE